MFFCSGEQKKNKDVFGKTFVPGNKFGTETRSRKKLFLGTKIYVLLFWGTKKEQKCVW